MIVFTDIDGTLYDYEGRMPESTREALRKLKENGHLVYFVTGRSKAEKKRNFGIWGWTASSVPTVPILKIAAKSSFIRL